MRLVFVYLYFVTNMAAKSADDTERLRQEIQLLSRQMMMQQFYVEEIARSNSNSGLKRVRISRFGQRPHLSSSHVDRHIAAIHNHANHMSTLGLGEMVVVMNGIEFKTRHNDYLLKKKHSKSKKFKATEDIEFPDVPPEVLEKKTVEGQVEEMKEWFKAWKEQDDSRRDYKKYFKPVLCYMEGFWMTSHMKDFDELFNSDRHFLDTKNWLDLQDKSRFFSYSGTMMSSENFSYLPTSVMVLRANQTTPMLAQWMYRILCQPLKDDLPTSFLRPSLDLKSRVAYKMDAGEYQRSLLARFYLSRLPDPERRVVRTLLDELMEQVPGLDNDLANLTDDVLGEPSYAASARRRLNTGYYHRVYRVALRPPNLQIRHRSFADQFLFVAQNSQTKVPALSLEKCNRAMTSCRRWRQRWSYAIPLEIVYLTPLLRWNPYNIPYRGGGWKSEGQAIYVDWSTGKKTRNGALGNALNGTNSIRYFQTPYQLFQDPEKPLEPARVTGVRFVLDRNGVERPVRASGTYVTLPEIPGVGALRQRYPIMPIHGEGSSVWKELSAIQDIVLKPNRYNDLFDIQTEEQAVSRAENVFLFQTNPSLPVYELHQHTLVIEEAQLRIAMTSSSSIEGGWYVEVLTEEALSHQHVIRLTCDPDRRLVVMVSCDSDSQYCDDGHDGFEGADAKKICDR